MVVTAELWFAGLAPAAIADIGVAIALRLAVACSVGWPPSQTRISAALSAKGMMGHNNASSTAADSSSAVALQLEHINAAASNDSLACSSATPTTTMTTTTMAATRVPQQQRRLQVAASALRQATAGVGLAFSVGANTTVGEAMSRASLLAGALARQAAGDIAPLMDTLADSGFFEAVERSNTAVEWSALELVAVNVTVLPVGAAPAPPSASVTPPRAASASPNSGAVLGAVLGSLAAVGLLALALLLHRRRRRLGQAQPGPESADHTQKAPLATGSPDSSEPSRPPAQALLLRASSFMPRSPLQLPHRPGSSLSPPPSRAHHLHHHPGAAAGDSDMQPPPASPAVAAGRVSLTPGRLAPHTRWGRHLAASSAITADGGPPDFRMLEAPGLVGGDGPGAGDDFGLAVVAPDFRVLEEAPEEAPGSTAPPDFVALPASGDAVPGRGGLPARLFSSSGPRTTAAGAVLASLAPSLQRRALGSVMRAPAAAGSPMPPLPGAPTPGRAPRAVVPSLRLTAPSRMAAPPASRAPRPAPPALAERSTSGVAAMLTRLHDDDEGASDSDDGSNGAAGAGTDGDDAPDWRAPSLQPRPPPSGPRVDAAASQQLERSWGAAPLIRQAAAATPPSTLMSVRVATGSSPLPPPGGWGDVGAGGGSGGRPPTAPSPPVPRRSWVAGWPNGAPGGAGALATARSAEKPGHRPAEHLL